jgi:hypothetical protein
MENEQDTSPTAVTPATTGYFKLEGKFTHLKATHDFSRCISHLPATLGRAKGRSAEDPGYVHIGDCKSIFEQLINAANGKVNSSNYSSWRQYLESVSAEKRQRPGTNQETRENALGLWGSRHSNSNQ